MAGNPVLDAALAAAKAGFPALPLHTPDESGACDCHKADCASPGKHPRTKRGLTDASTDEATIRRWWTAWPTANLGLAVPDGYAVLDVDVEDANEAVGGRDLGDTAVQRTGRGWQFVFATDRPIRPSVAVLPHVDVRGPGSYFVAPPSRHPNGRTYEWLVRVSEGVRPAPEWLYELSAERPRANGHAEPGEPIPSGQRNTTLARLAGSMRARGFGHGAILAALTAENAERCVPPLADAEVATIATSYAAYEPGEPAPEVLRGGKALDAPAEPALLRTLADVSDDAPEPLLFDVLEPHGPTLMYAAPGVGKGSTGAWLLSEAVRRGMRPLVMDAEVRPREWARRVSGLGGDRARVYYLNPADLGTKQAGRPLWENAEALREIVKAHGVDLFLLDSVLASAGVGDEALKSDAQVPFLFVRALDSLEVPTLTFGHPPKYLPAGDPYGSQSWLAAYRVVWLGMAAEGTGHRVRWRPKKRNERGDLATFMLTFEYENDALRSVARLDDDVTTREWLIWTLGGGPMTLAELVDAALDDDDYPTKAQRELAEERLGRTLRRMRKADEVEDLPGPRYGRRWTLLPGTKP